MKMMSNKFGLAGIFLLMALALTFIACGEEDVTGDKGNNTDNGVNDDKDNTQGVISIADNSTLTIGQRGQLTPPEGSVTWSSSNAAIATVSSGGIVTAVGISDRKTNTFVSGAGTGTVTITAKVSGGTSQTFTVKTTTAANGDIMSAPALKDLFKDYFLIGNIFNPGDANNASGINTARLTRHYNVLTPENNMKPSYLSASATTVNTTNMNTAVRMIAAAKASGLKVVGHTLLWHSQNASWMNSLSNDKDAVLTTMKGYIALIMGYTGIKGQIYSWDVLNEAFPDGVSASADWKTSMRDNNPWFKSIGSDFVYEGYLAARQADPNAILYYNDYNLDNAGKATMVRDMVRDVNALYKEKFPAETRLLIEGIGMQSHHNTGVTAAQIKASLDLFKPLGVKISISELDVLGQGYSQFSSVGQGTDKQGSSTVTNDGIVTQAKLYSEYVKLFIQYKDIIERVTVWGLTDDKSWRSAGLPTLFDPTGKAKPAYYRFVEALY